MSKVGPIFAKKCREWMEAKEAERSAVEQRRVIEDELLEIMQLDEQSEGVTIIDLADDIKFKVTSRISRRVDADMVQDIAAEHGLNEHLSSLFRWKPEIDAKAWKSTDASITDLLSEAITAKPSRPSFSITLNTEE